MPRYHVERSIAIAAPPEQVFQAAADFSSWTAWSPWLCCEPTAKVEVSDDPSSVGSRYSWEGELVGQGEMEHRELEPNRAIHDVIRFLKPFRTEAQVGFRLQPDDQGTQITWYMDGALPWFLFWMRSQMQAFIGMDYERGLKMLKERLETGQVLSQTQVRGVESIGPLRMAGVRQACTLREIGPAMESALASAEQNFHQHGIPLQGDRISVYHKFDIKANAVNFTAGIVLPESAGEGPAELSAWSLPASRALAVEHVGRYEHLGNAWSAAQLYARHHKLKQSAVGAFELYKNSPQDTDPAALRTEIYLPLKS